VARKLKAQVIALAAVAMAVAAAAGTYVLTQTGAGQSTVATAAQVQAGHAAAGADALKVLSVTPASGTRHVNGGEPVEVQFSAPLAAGSPSPVLSPAVAGRWSVTGSAMTFTPDEPFSPLTRVTVRVPGGADGVRSAAGGHLAAPVVSQFSTASYTGVRLAELLAQLGYLPLTWTPSASSSGHMFQDGSAGASQAVMAYSPPAGTFTWHEGYPSALTSQWQGNGSSVIVRGAVMAFEFQHGMATTGVATPRVWGALFRAVAAGSRNPAGYTYAVASKASPEMLTIWHDGRVVLRSPTNTGVPVSPTVDGTFPVYLRYRFQIMSGTNPDGSSYADPVSFVAYFNGGDAVHYFPRGSYGFQQSLGCVELPYSAAERAYPYLTYGSLVTVSG